MTQSRKQGCYWLGLVVLLGVFGAIASAVDAALAQQVAPDATLPLNSAVTSVGNNFTITGGTQVGSNLFHSFSQFSVPTNGQAFFNNALSVQNIISRVTGLSPSNIDGILRANGTANLFLLNPNGIIFGPNASLNVGGSFVGTTANAIQFGTQGFFSASVPNAPSPLLTVNPSALVFNQIAAASIQNNSVASLSVPDGQSLLLVGGDINMNGGRLNAFGGRVELGGLAGTGTVGLQVNSNNLSLSFPDGVARGDVSLTNGAIVDVRAANGGSIALNNTVPSGATGKAGDILITTGSLRVRDGARLDASTNGSGDAGNVTITAGDTVFFDGVGNSGASLAFSNVGSGAAGKGGDININTGSLTVSNGARLDASTNGSGAAGNVNITARDRVSFDGVGSNKASSYAFSNVGAGAAGKGGDININTGSLTVSNGARLDASTNGSGAAGNVNITARDTVSFDGVGSNGGSVAFSNVGAGAAGKGGDLNINTGSLTVRNGAQLDASTNGQGNAGNININTGSLTVLNSAQLDARTLGQGNAGNINININTGSLTVSNGTRLDASTRGTGNAGNVNITARDTVSFDGVGRNGSSAAFSNVEPGAAGKGAEININTGSLTVSNGARLDASSNGSGDAGKVKITARDTVSFDGVGSNGASSYAFSSVGSGAGKGGDININTGSLTVRNGARLDASTGGTGNAGNVNITARDTVSFDGVGSNQSSSFAFSSVGAGAAGKGGEININTGSLTVSNGARLDASTNGSGAAGNVNITARDTVSFDGVGSNRNSSVAFSSVEAGATGKGGDININTGSLFVTKGARLDALTNGAGAAGNVNITARDTVSFDGVGSNQSSSVAFSSVESPEAGGNGGDININTGSLSVLNGAQLIARTRGRGDAGKIAINARDRVSFDGVGSNESSSVAFSSVESGATGKGGGIRINTGTLSLANSAQLNANSMGQGTAGNIEVRSRSINLDKKATLTATSSFGQGGDINLIVQDLLLLRRGSEITTNAGTPGTRGDGGNITIDAPSGLIVAVPKEVSHIRANAFKGKGGTVNIKTSGVFGFQINPPQDTLLSDITASSDLGPQGIVTINTPDVDPSRGVFVLPVQVVDPSQKIASGCSAGDGTTGNSFTVTGRGGLPPSPDEPLSSDVVWSDTRLTNIGNRENLKASVPIRSHSKALEIVPATGWVFNGKGEVTLIANSPSTFYPSDSRPSTCHGK